MGVQWLDGGGISGYEPVSGEFREVAARFVPSSTGCVDVAYPTREQYRKPSLLVKGLYTKVRLRVGSQETAFASSLGNRRVSATIYVVKASYWTGVPAPGDVIFYARSGFGHVQRSTVRAPESIPVGSPEEIDFYFTPMAHLEANTKYWIVALPTAVLLGTPPKDDYLLSPDPNDINVLGKGLSFWTNRTPNAPSIMAPAPGTSVAEGETFDLTVNSGDPDAGFQMTTAEGRDWAGIHVQYAPTPTRAEPNPAWQDLTFATAGAPNPGWSFVGNVRAGADTLLHTGTVEVRGGSQATTSGKGILPSGEWQIRVRTFDWGHPMPYVTGPGPTDDAYTPSTYPAVNTSPWSVPVTVTVTARVPAPVPLSPADGSAVQADRLTTLSWRYRNTATPPSPQKGRIVQMRKVGDPSWTTLVSGNSTSQTHVLQQGGSPTEYLPDGTFEGGTAGSWVAGVATGTWGAWGSDTTTLEVIAHPQFTGQKILRAHGMSLTQSGVMRDFTLGVGHEIFVLQGRVRGGTSGNGRSVCVQVAWFAADNTALHVDTIGTTSSYDWETFNATLSRPVNAAKATVQVFAPYLPPDTGFYIDDFSLLGSPVNGGAIELEPNTQYEWRVQTEDSTSSVSDFSAPARFWAVPPPLGNSTPALPADTIEAATLGCGKHRIEVYRRGGLERIGEITSLSLVDWGRLRDDISSAKFVVEGKTMKACAPLLESLRPWGHEIVVYRDNGSTVDRVWEGPVTMVTHEADRVTIHAKDVMAYVYRRIIRQSLSDSRFGDTVVNRAVRVLQNALAPDDPNLLQYLTPIPKADDARQYRSTPAYSRTAFEEIDDMASNSGLDYAAVGRSIMIWGTKHRIGTLPEFRDGDLGSTPIVSIYGMSMGTRYVVSDGNGVWGAADAVGTEDGVDPFYGLVELLSSSWAADSDVDAGSFTAEDIAKTVKAFEGFAERTLSTKYPAPVVVRVPDNTTINPQAAVSIQHLVPGVVIPLRSTGTLIELVADQKLDSIKVTEQNGTENITITMSPFSNEDNSMEEVAE